MESPVQRILFIAPQPFFQERGTPIAVRLSVETLAKSFKNMEIDLLTFGEGSTIELPSTVTHTRCIQPLLLRNISPGLSVKKIFTDIFLTCSAIKLLATKKYTFIHGVEEGGIIAWWLSIIFRVPYIFDMDSKIVADVIRQWRWLAPFIGVFKTIEAGAIKHATGIISVCDSLAERAKRVGGKNIHVVTDCSLINEADTSVAFDNLRDLCRCKPTAPLMVYIGNLESYQGIDLLIDSVARCSHLDFHCVILGGSASKIAYYKEKVDSLKLSNHLSIVGPRPIASIGHYLKQADILVSPRSTEANTPMKIYSYLHAGKAILATDLSTHTQVLSSQWAYLAPATAEGFAQGIATLVNDKALCLKLGAAAYKRAIEHHTSEVFEKAFSAAYQDFLGTQSKSIRVK